MNLPPPGEEEQELFTRDLNNGWNEPIKCAWTNTVAHSNELYDIHGVGDVKNVLCLRLFASSLYEIANSDKDPVKMMSTIFGDRFMRNIADHDMQIYESITQTVQHLSWKIRKAQILIFRRNSANHGWRSVREILIRILSDDETAANKDIVAGMSATILQDIFRCHVENICFRKESPLLPKSRFHEIFRVAFLLFNDSIGEYIQSGKAEVVYEMLASRLVYFYTRLVADTWRILVLRNGPKVETEWYMLRGIEENSTVTGSRNSDQSTSTSRNQLPRSSNNKKNSSENVSLYHQSVSHSNFVNQFANQRPLKKH